MSATVVVHTNQITRSMTLSDLREFIHSCDAEGLPEDVVLRVRANSWWQRTIAGRRLVEISADRRERLGNEKNEPAAIRHLLDLPPSASSEDVLRGATHFASGATKELLALGERLARALGVEEHPDDSPADFMRRLAQHAEDLALTAPGSATREHNPSAQELSNLLSLVGVPVPTITVNAWSSKQFDAALRWAAATHMSASDHDIPIPDRPDFLPKG